MTKASPTQPPETLPLDNRHPPWVDRRQFPFTSRFLEIEGHRVHYVDEGSGATILFLHGNPTWSFLYRHIIADLKTDFRCVAVDYPGFGLSRAAVGYGFTNIHGLSRSLLTNST